MGDVFFVSAPFLLHIGTAGLLGDACRATFTRNRQTHNP